jgi:hypothetical protein
MIAKKVSIASVVDVKAMFAAVMLIARQARSAPKLVEAAKKVAAAILIALLINPAKIINA